MRKTIAVVLWTPFGAVGLHQNMGDQDQDQDQEQRREFYKQQATQCQCEESGGGNTTEKLCFIIRKKNEKIQKINFQLTEKDNVIGKPGLICILIKLIK